MPSPAQPHIILIDTDQQRADTIRAAGAPWMLTPNLDRRARRELSDALIEWLYANLYKQRKRQTPLHRPRHRFRCDS